MCCLSRVFTKRFDLPFLLAAEQRGLDLCVCQIGYRLLRRYLLEQGISLYPDKPSGGI